MLHFRNPDAHWKPPRAVQAFRWRVARDLGDGRVRRVCSGAVRRPGRRQGGIPHIGASRPSRTVRPSDLGAPGGDSVYLPATGGSALGVASATVYG